MCEYQKWIIKTLELAKKGRGFTSPNPVVGSVIIKNNKIISEGYHKKFGDIHAEAMALKIAGDEARGATLYVNLEPCSIFGKTPPCTDAIIEAGITKVIIGTTDPNPKINGSGIKKLRNSGIEVITDVMKKECDEINKGFFTHIQKNRPWITLKLAFTADGYLADASGRSKWITSSDAREYVMTQRTKYDAIMVGAGTVMVDDPGLLPQSKNGFIPYRIVIDDNLAIPYRNKLVSDDFRNRTVIVTCVEGKDKKKQELKNRKLSLLEVENDGFGWVNLEKAFHKLSKFGITSIYCEGGGQLAGSLVNQGLIDELQLFIAPKILGKGIFGFSGIMRSLEDSINLEWEDPVKIGRDILLKGKLI